MTTLFNGPVWGGGDVSEVWHPPAARTTRAASKTRGGNRAGDREGLRDGGGEDFMVIKDIYFYLIPAVFSND